MDPSLEKKKKSLDNYTRYSGIAFQMLIIILIGVFGGIKLDQWLKLTFPVFTVILSILAVILSIYTVTKDLMKTPKGPENKGPENK
jgi:F0F1-type ATP synthase assembly protein I